ncbi:MBL fold metallo-hydrolase [Limimaricola hongkongensis]|uniref:Metallo-beta-lactamase family protein n=1 Tax=Limimaricola hongkongensis DSM 17492 TaxID=1122180 RepID=A0A017HCT0_9RHOB|nr:MBL fold metallo-hydrolase [Limimaricola hongkongensis]EYD72186.1 Metallo-beta-lactamase family protein [Limimaricola hongkongensis DSM 17492]
MSHSISRRAALMAGAALPLAASAGLPGTARAQSAPAENGVALPTHRAFTLGDVKVTTLLAGSRVVPEPHAIFGLNVDDATFAQVSEENFIPSEEARFFFNPVLVEAGENVILVDTGLDAAGITAALEAAGRSPGDVTHVVLTHMHGDHIGGLMTEAGEKTFANASHHAGRVEFDHWAGQDNEGFEAKVRPLEAELQFIEDGDQLGPLTAMAAFGHTPGHLVFTVTGSEGELLLMADTANHYVWSVGEPDWHVSFDTDKDMAVETRRRVLSMAAERKMPVIGYHMPFPGAGYVMAVDDGFAWVPHSYQLTL